MNKVLPKWLSTLILSIVFIAGLSLLLYPTVSNYWNSFHQSQAIASYESALADLKQEQYDELWAQAEEYNAKLRSLDFPLADYQSISDDYYAALDVDGSGIIGYISIDAIDVNIPIYHGTSDGVLNVAAGHLEGTSLPTGGASTHAVISAHRGLPSAKLFSDLDELEEGDTFSLVVLDQVMTYEIDQILIVLPSEVSALNVVDDEDHVTLLTCTPYGINTHRMLVRGVRIENPDDVSDLRVTADAIQINTLLVALCLAVPILVILGILAMIVRRKPKY